MINHAYPVVVRMAIRALFYELTLTPKPGLVDCYNSGAHQDMDYFTFLSSIESLIPHFQHYYEVGQQYHRPTLDKFFDLTRLAGMQGEKDMLCATKQINTHKGANFSFAVILAATGYYMKETKKVLPFCREDTKEILNIVRDMCKHLIEKDFAHLDKKQKLSYGEYLYVTYGITGIRGEASQGYPQIYERYLPYLSQQLQKGHPLDIALLNLLMYISSEIEDTNLIHRGGIDAWKTVQAEAKHFLTLDLPITEIKPYIFQYDQELIKRHLSPGGAADMLALVIFFAYLEGFIQS